MGTCRGKQIVGPRLRSGDAACSLRFRKASACCSDARPRLGTAEQRAWRHDTFVGAGQRGEAALATSLAVKGTRAHERCVVVSGVVGASEHPKVVPWDTGAG